MVTIVFVLTLGNTTSSSGDLIILGKGHAPIYVSDKDSNRFDFNNDGLTDYSVRAHYSGNEKQLYKVDYKIQDECVDGSTYDSATMKLGFTTREIDFAKRTWISEGIEVWNPWFRSANNDENKVIDLVYLPLGALPIPYPSSGDDVIQSSSQKKTGSFIYKNSIKELDNQSGWEGSIFFNAPQGKYYLWTIHPAEGTSGCDTLAAMGIPINTSQLK